MLIKENCQFGWTCDECENDTEMFSPNDDFGEVWNDLKEEGWRAYQEDGEWKHKCPDCFNAWRGRR